MAEYKCPDCGAGMILVNHYDGTGIIKCEYCGKQIPVNIQMPSVSKDPAFDSMINELRRRISEASGKEKAKLEKKLARELAYRANLYID